MDSEEEKRLAEEQERIKRENQEKNSGNAYNNLRSAQKNINNLRRGARAGRVVGKQTARVGRAAAQGGKRAAAQGGKVAARAGAATARIAAQLAAQAATATAELLAATSEVWVPVAAIIIGVVLFIMIISAAFVFFFSGTPVVNGGDLVQCAGTCKTSCDTASEVQDSTATSCTDATPICCVPKVQCTSLGGTCSSSSTCADVPKTQPYIAGVCDADPTKPTCCLPESTIICDPNDPDKSLKDSFNIVTSGLSSKANKYTVCKAFADASKSVKYLSLLKNGGTLLISFISGIGCSGFTSGANQITVRNGSCFTTTPYILFRKFMVHESGHVIKNRNPVVYQSFPYTTLLKQDSSCFDQGYFKSYTLRCGSSCGIDPRDESFAETIGQSLTTTAFGLISIPNWATTCPHVYNWTRDNVFGGYTFY